MKILTLTGPSCSGKTTLLNELVEKHGYASIISHTSRPMRPGEIDGKDYHFVDQHTFDVLKDSEEFIESISFNGFSYGVSIHAITEVNNSGKKAVLIVEPNGLIQMFKYAKDQDLLRIEIKSVYIGGNTNDLIERYIGRLVDENLGGKGVAKRHAKRIESMINERIQWRPLDIDLSSEVTPDIMRFETIPYVIKLKKLGPENFQETITKINELEYKND